jgi:hypothetical protein
VTETPTRSGARRRGLLAAAALLLVVAAAWAAERQIGDGAPGDDGPPASVYSVAVTRDGELLRTFAVAELQALPTATFTAEGKVQEGPTLLSVLDAAGVGGGFDEVEITGMGIRDEGRLVLAADAVDDTLVLDFAERGTVKVVSPELSWRERVRDVVEIAVR